MNAATFDCVFKHQYLLKYLVLCAPNGRILLISGPYGAGDMAPDCEIMDYVFIVERPDLRAWIQEGDVGLFDKGIDRSISLTCTRVSKPNQAEAVVPGAQERSEDDCRGVGRVAQVHGDAVGD